MKGVACAQNSGWWRIAQEYLLRFGGKRRKMSLSGEVLDAMEMARIVFASKETGR